MTRGTHAHARQEPRRARAWYNANSGHTYWLDGDGELMAAPTPTHGAPDWESGVQVDDFFGPLTQLEKASIMERLLARSGPASAD